MRMRSSQVASDEALAAFLQQQEEEEMANEWQAMDDYSRFSLSDDEKMAKSLQEQEYMANNDALTDDVDQLTYQFQDIGVNGSTSQHAEGHVGSSSNASSHSLQGLPPDGDIDIDNMSYEQLNQLGESIGSVNKGLSKRSIGKILTRSTGDPVSEKSLCVICMEEPKKKDKLCLPCKHVYHKECITDWLKDNKSCCVCHMEFN